MEQAITVRNNKIIKSKFVVVFWPRIVKYKVLQFQVVVLGIANFWLKKMCVCVCGIFNTNSTNY